MPAAGVQRLQPPLPRAASAASTVHSGALGGGGVGGGGGEVGGAYCQEWPRCGHFIAPDESYTLCAACDTGVWCGVACVRRAVNGGRHTCPGLRALYLRIPPSLLSRSDLRCSWEGCGAAFHDDGASIIFLDEAASDIFCSVAHMQHAAAAGTMRGRAHTAEAVAMGSVLSVSVARVKAAAASAAVDKMPAAGFDGSETLVV